MYYYLGYGSVSIVTHLLFFIYMYVLLSTVICCMNVFYVDYSSLLVRNPCVHGLNEY